MTKPGDLGKDKPDPVSRLSSGPQLIEYGVVGGRLGGEETMEVVAITHTLCVARYVCFRTTSCLPMLDCKAGHSLLLYQNKLEVQRDRNQRPVHYQCVDKPKNELGNGALPEVTNV